MVETRLEGRSGALNHFNRTEQATQHPPGVVGQWRFGGDVAGHAGVAILAGGLEVGADLRRSQSPRFTLIQN